MEDRVSYRNNCLFEEAKHYFSKNYNRIKEADLTEEDAENVNKSKIEVEELYKQFQLEIQVLNEEAKKTALPKDVYEVYEDFNHGTDPKGKRNQIGRHCKLWHELLGKQHSFLKKMAEIQGVGYKCESGDCPNFCRHCWHFYPCIDKIKEK